MDNSQRENQPQIPPIPVQSETVPSFQTPPSLEPQHTAIPGDSNVPQLPTETLPMTENIQVAGIEGNIQSPIESNDNNKENPVREWLEKAKREAENTKREAQEKIKEADKFLAAVSNPEMASVIQHVLEYAQKSDEPNKWVDKNFGQSNPTIATAEDANLKAMLSSLQTNNVPQEQSA